MEKLKLESEIERLQSLVDCFNTVEDIIEDMVDEKEYNRARDYLRDRYDHALNYNHDKFKKVAKKETK